MPSDDSKKPRPFDVATIERLVAMMSEHNLHEIDLYEDDHRIRLRRGHPGGGHHGGHHQPHHGHGHHAPHHGGGHMPPPAPAHTHAPAAEAPRASAPAKVAESIKSPTPGTFYKAANPDSPAFVTVGSRVTPSTVVCIIEAMKIFNEIQAERAGVITKILVENGQPVEYDQPLFEIDPAG